MRGLIAAACVLVGLGGLCGCGDTPATPPGPVVRIEIEPKGLLLTAVGASRQLSARGYDAQGRAVAATTVAWRSSTASSVTVDAQGVVVAQVANGASQIFAESGGVTSAPLLVAVTVLPPRALAVTDSQVVGAPTATDPSAAPVAGATYEVVLTGVDPPVPGTLVIGTEAQPVGGKVVSAQQDGANVRVTLAVVPVKELLPSLSIKELIDLSNVDVEIPGDLKETYDITRDGQTIRFDPTTRTKGSALSGSIGTLRQAAKLSGRLGPFECELDATGVSQWPVTLSQPPALSINKKLALDFVYTSGVGLERLVAKGDVGVTYDGSLTVALGFQGVVSCAKELAVIRIPVAGVLSWVISGLVPVSIVVELSGKLTLANLVVGAKAEAKAQAEFGVACPGGTNCGFVRNVTGSASAEPVWKKPTANDLRVDASLTVAGKVELGIGNPVFPKVRFSAVSVRSGPMLEGSFAPWTEQILDTGYSSSYGLSLVSKAGVGVDLPKVLAQFGLTDITVLELSTVVQLAQSPKGKLTANKGAFVANDKVNFQVTLDPATITFPPTIGRYNVRDIILVRKVGASSVVEAGRVSAAAGQTSFSIPYTAKDSGQTSEFSAFVMTYFLPFDNLALELEPSLGSCKVTDLGTLGGECEAFGLNNTGQVVGECATSAGSGTYLAFLWDGTMQGLGTLGGTSSRARGVNDAKDVVGVSTLGSGEQRAFLWRNGSMQNLGTLGGNHSVAFGINQAGHVVGTSSTGAASGYRGHAFLWKGGMTDLGALGADSGGYALNDADQVVGYVLTGPESATGHACLFSGGVQDLGTGSWARSAANAINASGLIVGVVSNSSYDDSRAVSWSGGSLTMLSGGTLSAATGVNDAGVIVGESNKRAVRWKDGKEEDLNSLLPAGSGWTLIRARAINKQGDIVGTGSSAGGQRAFLLTCGK